MYRSAALAVLANHVLAWDCSSKEGHAIQDVSTSSECGGLQSYDCCARCYQRQYTEGCVASTWNSTGCCTYHATITSGTSPKDGSTALISSWAPAPGPPPAPPPPTPTPPVPTPPPPTPPTPTPSPPPPPSPTPPATVPCGTDLGGTWEIRESCKLTCPNPSCSYAFDTIRVFSDGELLIDDTVDSTTIFARRFVVEDGGKLIAGSEEQPFTSQFEIVLTGDSSDQDNPSIEKEDLGHGAGVLPYSKVLLGKGGSTIGLHGTHKTSWVKLAATVHAGSTDLVLAEQPEGWKQGDQLLVPTTGFGAQTGENEIVTLVKVEGKTVTISEALKFDHYGASPDSRLNGEVGVLTRNVRVTGSNDKHEECLQAMKGSFGDRGSLNNIRDLCYGGHTSTMAGATFQISNVELTRLGQATRIARYPVHWHLAGDVSDLDNYAKNNAIWENYQRCVTVHGTWGASVEDNLCYYTHGHAFYLEDAIEHNNRFVGNLAVKVRRGPMICTDSQIGPSAFWITNPNNTFVGNQAVDIGGRGHGIGYWVISGGEIDKEKDPTWMGTDFWSDDFASKKSGLVFNPSRNVFGPNGKNSGPTWLLNQEQGRTPLKEFRGNGVRSSFRGVHVDGFITSSVPGEIGDDLHSPEDIHVFGTKDGTCNYFPAGNYAIPSGEGMRVFVPTEYDYDAVGNAQNFKPTHSIMQDLHVSRSYEAWWSRASRINITNAVFAWNWVGMTNHIPGPHFCPAEGIPENLGLANNVVNTLFIGHGDDAMNKMICEAGYQGSQESPAGIRQYDGAFWLTDSRWTNMSIVACPESSGNIKTLPYALVAGRQLDCNGKFPIQLFDSWPLGASPSDSSTPFAWALPAEATTQNLGQFSGTASCSRGPSGGVVDMTGTLDPQHKSAPTAYFAESGRPGNPGELATYTLEQLQAMDYVALPATQSAAVQSAAWSSNTMENPDFAHTCGYCFYDESNNCPSGPSMLHFI